MQETSASAGMSRLLSPSSIAVIGASSDARKYGAVVLSRLVSNGFAGALYPIHRTADELNGLRCYQSVTAIGAPVDLAIVALPGEHVLEAVRECAAHGVGAVVILSAGVGGEYEAAEMKALAQRSGTRLLGPNCEGFYNEVDNVAATFSATVEAGFQDQRHALKTQRVAVVSQSGGVGFALFHHGLKQGLRFSSVVTVGNGVDVTLAELFGHFVDDPETAAILLYIEAIDDAAAFCEAARRAAAKGKPVIAVKVGSSEAGQRATASHTGSLAGWGGAYLATFAKYGIHAARSAAEAVGLAALHTACPRPRGGRIAIAAVSGGFGAWTADALSEAGLQVPSLSVVLQEELATVVPAFGSTHNPVDTTAGSGRNGILLSAIEKLAASDEVDAVVAVLSLSSAHRQPTDAAELGRIVSKYQKPIVCFSYAPPSELGIRTLSEAKALVFDDLSNLSAVLRAAVAQSTYRSFAPPADRVEAVLPGVEPGVLSEAESKDLLAACGLELPPRRLVSSEDELEDAFAQIGSPAVLKLQSRALPHKSDAGAVKLNICTLEDAKAAFANLMAIGARHCDGDVQGVLVEPMARTGAEVIVGAVRDETFGPMIMVGAGGVLTELLRDSVLRPAPVGVEEARAMIETLRVHRLLRGYRGQAPTDVDAMARLVSAVSQIAARHRDSIAELDLNPVLVHGEGEGVTILDALITVAPG